MAEPDPDAQAAFVAALADPAAPPPAAIGERQRRRFDIHRNNVAHAMVEALRATFPAVERLVGAEFFAALARAHLAAEPPASPLLFRYGGGFPAFLEAFPPAARVPYLGDVARLEWARLGAYHAADAAPLGLDALAALPESALADARLELHPSLTLLASRWPVVALWAASTGNGPAEAVDLARPEAVAVLRPRLEVETRPMSPAAHAFLAALAQGRPLGAAATEAAAQHDGFDLAEHLSGVFSIGAVAAIRPPSPKNTEGDDA